MRLRNLKPYKLNRAIIELDDERNQRITGYEEIGTINADIQPCSGQFKVELYGKEIIMYKTVYMNIQHEIKEGLYIEIGSKQYEIQPIETWQTHMRFDIKVVN